MKRHYIPKGMAADQAQAIVQSLNLKTVEVYFTNIYGDLCQRRGILDADLEGWYYVYKDLDALAAKDRYECALNMAEENRKDYLIIELADGDTDGEAAAEADAARPARRPKRLPATYA